MWAASRMKGSDKDARLIERAKVKGKWEGPWSIADFYQLLSHVLSASPLAAFSEKLPDTKDISCLRFTSNQNKEVCKAFFATEEGRVLWRQEISPRDPGPELHELECGYVQDDCQCFIYFHEA